VKRWLALFLGVGIAAAAFAALLAGRTPPPVHGDIDADSRARLEAVLQREASAERPPARTGARP
jgi:hypothetical protein